jgi:hypothetical protein
MAGTAPGYEGEIAAIQCGVGGLNANLNPSRILLKNVIQAEGVVMRQDHWRKEPGTALFGTITPATADPADNLIVALNDWHPTEAVQRIVSLRGDGKLYFTIANPGETGDPGAFVSTTTSGVGTRFGFFVTGGSESSVYNRKLFLFRKNKLPTYVNGDVTNDVVIDRPAADWSDAHPPIVGIVNGGRLWAAGNTNNPHQLYASTLLGAAGPPAGGPMTDFITVGGFTSDTQSLSIFPGVGERIFALRNYQGFIVVFKYPRGIFLQDARDTDPANWLTQQITDAIGIAKTPYAAVQLENDILFMGSDGLFYLFSAVLAAATGQQNMETANLAMDLQIYQFLIDAYNRNILDQVQSVYQPFWQTATFTIPGEGSTKNNTRFMFDFNAVGRQGGEPRFTYSFRDQAASLALWRDPFDFIDKPMFGDYFSDVIFLEQEERTAWDGALYPMRVQTPHNNLGEFETLNYGNKFVQFANRNKIFDNLEVEYAPFTDALVVVSIFVDGIFRQRINIFLKEGGKPLGDSDIDTDAFIIGDSLLAGGVVRSVVRRLNAGSGRRISLLFENIGAGEDVALTHLFLGFRPGDTTQTPRSGG